MQGYATAKKIFLLFYITTLAVLFLLKTLLSSSPPLLLSSSPPLLLSSSF
jgi:hypothetical protein